MSPLGYGREYRRRSGATTGYKLLLAVAIVLAIGVLVGMVLQGDPGPGLGADGYNPCGDRSCARAAAGLSTPALSPSDAGLTPHS
jgi:hypothetical protein